MSIIIDFLEGRASFEDFWKEWNSDPELRNWFDSLVDLKSDLPDEWVEDERYCGIRRAIHKHYGGCPSKFLNSSPFPDKRVPVCYSVSGIYNTIAAVVTLAYPNIKTIARYDDEATYYNSAVSEYYGGDEVVELIDDILNQYPLSMGKTKRAKQAKAALKEAFHVEGNVYPRWAQEPEWPMGKNSPMKFERKERIGELVRFFFVDVDTKEEKVVEQLY